MTGEKRNLTIQLDEEIIQAAKELATRRGMSVSGMVSQNLRELVEADVRYRRAMHHALDEMDKAVDRGGRNWQREDLYDRWENSKAARGDT